jgi:hypothetical protein
MGAGKKNISGFLPQQEPAGRRQYLPFSVVTTISIFTYILMYKAIRVTDRGSP